MDLQAINVPDSGMNNNNAGGTYPYIFLVKHSEATGFEVAASPATPDAVPVIPFSGVGGLTNMKKIEVTEEMCVVRDELIGETDGKSYAHFGEFKIPGNDLKNLGLASSVKNARLIALICEEDGTIRVIGNSVCPARLTEAAGTSGDTRESKNGRDYTIKSYGNTVVPVLTGTTVANLVNITEGSGSGGI